MSYPMIQCCFRICLASLLLVPLGCATQSDYPSYPAPAPTVEPAKPLPEALTPQPEAVAPAPASAPAMVLNLAAGSYAKRARSQYQERDYQAAIATAERGLRIERRAADLYLVLAQSYVQLGMPSRAAIFVQQGLRFALAGSETEESLLRVRQLLGD